MASTPVTPTAPITSTIAVNGTPVSVIAAAPEGGFITNPANASESLFVDPTGADPLLSAEGTTFELQPGQTWEVIAGQTTVTKANAATAGHKFSAVQVIPA